MWILLAALAGIAVGYVVGVYERHEAAAVEEADAQRTDERLPLQKDYI